MSYKRNPSAVTLGSLRSLLQPMFADQLLTGLRETLETDGYVEEVVQAFPTLRAKFNQLIESKAPVAVGSDCGSPGHFHHDSIWWELASWKSLRVPMEQTLHAATTTGAEIMGKSDVGRLEVGQRGDILVYRGNILVDPLRADRVHTVIKGGVVYVDDGAWVGAR